MTSHEVKLFLEKDKEVYRIAWRMTVVLGKLDIIKYSGLIVKYWIYKFEPHRDEIHEYIQDKSR